MGTLYIDRRGVEADVEGASIVVRKEGERRSTAPLALIDRVVAGPGARLTSRLLARLAERGIGLLVLGGSQRKPAAAMIGPPGGDAALRLAQYALMNDEKRRARISAGFVRARLRGQIRLLERIEEDKGAARPLRRAVEDISRALCRLEGPPLPRRRLVGVEGAAAAAFFRGYARAFAPSLKFSGRNRRPPRDPVNVCLSLGYTLLYHDATRALSIAGLDPSLGVYHDIAPGRASLANDFSEPCRALIEDFVWKLFKSGALDGANFSTRGRSCRLNKPGRKVFYHEYEVAAPLHRRYLRRLTRAFVRELGADPGALTALPEPEKPRKG